MPDTFDPYREALVMETEIAWPDGYEERDASELTRIAADLHATPAHGLLPRDHCD